MFDNEDEKDRIIMFSTQEAMDHLGSCKILHMDGTVESGPILFDQMYTIHGKISRCKLDKCECENCGKTIIHKMISKRFSRKMEYAAGSHIVY